ncbi:MAG: nucleotidyltransferase family protein [Magnetococcales bacterium]|nr:nucleotidyltransferase family protein [Magnetococcales bacterium]
MMDLSEVQSKRHEIFNLAKQYGIKSIRLFGSIVTGMNTPESDIDFLVEVESEWSLLDRIALIQELEELLDCPVDLVQAKSLHWYVQDKILSEAVQL